MNNQNQTQYFLVAKQAYSYVIQNRMDARDAWERAAQYVIKSQNSIEKGCPRAVFVGLCESGDLIGIPKTKQSDSPNYLYAKFAINEWKKGTASKSEMWERVKIQFPNGAKNHQGQLDVVIGLWNYIK